jgi:hypothetical protein
MSEKSPAEIRAWIAASNIARFRTELEAETNEFRHNILIALLAIEREKFEKEPLLCRSNGASGDVTRS